MNTLFEADGILPNRQTIKVGDVVKAKYYMYTCFSVVTESGGILQIKGPGPFCFLVDIHHFISQHGEVEKVTPVDVYRFCKKNGWEASKYLAYFRGARNEKHERN